MQSQQNIQKKQTQSIKMTQSKIHSQKVIIVKTIDEDLEGPHLSIDPLQQQITSMKITMNLMKQISFNNSINKLDNFQELLKRQYNLFNKKIQTIISNQKQLLKKIKNIQQKTDKKIKKIDQYKLQKDMKNICKVRQESQKYKKLSIGMLIALEDIQNHLDGKNKNKSQIAIQKKNSNEKNDNIKNQKLQKMQKVQDNQKNLTETNKTIEKDQTIQKTNHQQNKDNTQKIESNQNKQITKIEPNNNKNQQKKIDKTQLQPLSNQQKQQTQIIKKENQENNNNQQKDIEIRQQIKAPQKIQQGNQKIEGQY